MAVADADVEAKAREPGFVLTYSLIYRNDSTSRHQYVRHVQSHSKKISRSV